MTGIARMGYKSKEPDFLRDPVYVYGEARLTIWQTGSARTGRKRTPVCMNVQGLAAYHKKYGICGKRSPAARDGLL